MRPRLVTLVAVVIAVASIALALIGLIRFSSAKSPALDASLPTAPASYLGVYAAGPPQRYGPVARFATTIGKQPNLVGYYSGWPEQFATSFAETVHQHDAVPIVQMDPTNASVAAIAAGEYDDYLRSFAHRVREFGHAVVIGFGHEMNASWYSWGYHHVKASTFVAAWRHIVSLFRAQGAENVTWLWTINQDLKSTGPLVSWWPGARYVTWVGIDGYYVPSIRHLRQRVRPDDCAGAGIYPQASAAVRDSRRGRCRPSGKSPGPVRGHARVSGPRPGVVRHSPAPGDLPPGLARRRPSSSRDSLPAGRVHADPDASLMDTK